MHMRAASVALGSERQGFTNKHKTRIKMMSELNIEDGYKDVQIRMKDLIILHRYVVGMRRAQNVIDYGTMKLMLTMLLCAFIGFF